MREQYVDLEEEETTTTLFSDIVQDNPPPPDYHIFKNFLPPDSPDNGEEEEVEEEDEEMGDDEEDTVKVDVDADIDSDLAKMCRYCLESFGDKKILWKHVARHKKRGHESLFDDGKEKKVESDEMKTMLIDDDKEKVETVTTLFDDDDKVKVKTETMKTISSDEEEEYDEILLRKGIRFAQQVGNDVLPDAVYSPEAVPIQLEVVISPVEGLSFYNETEEMLRGNGDVDMGIPAGAEILSPPIYATNIVSSSSSLNDADDSSFFNEEQGDTEEMGNVDVDMGIPAGAAILADLSTSSVSSSSTSVTPNDTDDSDAADTSSTYSDGDSSEENVPLHYDYDSEDIEIEVLTVEEIRRREEAAIFKDKVKQLLRNLQLGDYAPQPPEDDEDDDDDYPKEFPCTLCSAGFDTALEKEDHWRVNHFYYQRACQLSKLERPPNVKDYPRNNTVSLVNPTRRLENSEGAVSLTVNVKRKPGRPRIHRDPEPIVERKPDSLVNSTRLDNSEEATANVKRKPGRPRLHPDPGPKPMVKRKPGRPRIHRDPEPEPEPKFIKPIPGYYKEFYEINVPPPPLSPEPQPNRKRSWDTTKTKKRVTFKCDYSSGEIVGRSLPVTEPQSILKRRGKTIY